MRIFTILFLITCSIYSADVEISGTIVDPDNKPLKDATIKLLNRGWVEKSDGNGYFKLDGIVSNAFSHFESSLNLLNIEQNYIIIDLEKSQNVSINLHTINGKKITLLSNLRLNGKNRILCNKLNNLADGIYVLTAKLSDKSISRKIIMTNSKAFFNHKLSKSKNISIRSNKRDVPSFDTLLIEMDGFYKRRFTIRDSVRDYGRIVLGRNTPIYDSTYIFGLDELVIKNHWTDIVWWGPDSVDDGITKAIILDTSSIDTIDATLIVDRGNNADEPPYKCASVGVPFQPYIYYHDYSRGIKILEYTKQIIVSYMVESPDDTLAFFITTGNDLSGIYSIGLKENINGEDRYYSAFRAVLTKGADNPGEIVKDTLTYDDFSLQYGQDDFLLMNKIGYNINPDGSIYLKENLFVLDTLSAFAFESEANISGVDTTTLKVCEIKLIGGYHEKSYSFMPYFKRSGWLYQHDSTSSVDVEWHNDNEAFTVTLIRGASDADNNHWSYAAAQSIINPKSSFDQILHYSIKYVCPNENDTLAVSLESLDKFGADIEEDWAYGNFRVELFKEEDPFDTTLKAGDTITNGYRYDSYTLNWADTNKTSLRINDNFDYRYKASNVNSFAFFSEKDNGPGGDAEKGDTLIFTILDVSARMIPLLAAEIFLIQ